MTWWCGSDVESLIKKSRV